MGNAIFVVWRESLEAVLIIGILRAFLSRKSGLKKSVAAMWLGVGAGVLMSVILAVLTIRVQDQLVGNALEYFQATILLVSALLMTQMVFWMKKHSRHLKSQLESNLSQAMGTSGLWGVALVSAFSVAREGAETVVYLYGLALENKASGWSGILLASLVGLSLALFTAWVVSKGIRFLNYGMFFKVTSLILLFSAAGLWISGMNRLIEVGVLPALMDPLWNTSKILDSSSFWGGIVAAFTGYRSRPSLTLLLAYAIYWACTVGWMKKDQFGFAPRLQRV